MSGPGHLACAYLFIYYEALVLDRKVGTMKSKDVDRCAVVPSYRLHTSCITCDL